MGAIKQGAANTWGCAGNGLQSSACGCCS